MNDSIIAGALFDFMGWLTSRPKRIMLSSVDDASPAVDAIRDFAKLRGLSLDGAQVQTWQEALAQPEQELLGNVEYIPCCTDQTCSKCKPTQPEQEPVAWMNDSTPSGIFARHIEGAKNFGCTVPLYTTPPQRTWVGLTFAEICECENDYLHLFARAIEAKLKEKNT